MSRALFTGIDLSSSELSWEVFPLCIVCVTHWGSLMFPWFLSTGRNARSSYVELGDLHVSEVETSKKEQVQEVGEAFKIELVLCSRSRHRSRGI